MSWKFKRKSKKLLKDEFQKHTISWNDANINRSSWFLNKKMNQKKLQLITTSWNQINRQNELREKKWTYKNAVSSQKSHFFWASTLLWSMDSRERLRRGRKSDPLQAPEWSIYREVMILWIYWGPFFFFFREAALTNNLIWTIHCGHVVNTWLVANWASYSSQLIYNKFNST